MFSVNGDSIVKFEKEDKTRNGTYFQDRILKSKYNNKNYADSDGKCSQSILGVRIGRKIAGFIQINGLTSHFQLPKNIFLIIFYTKGRNAN